MKRLAALLVTCLLGTTGALFATAPAHAAQTCTLKIRTTLVSTEGGQATWIVQATLTNTGTAPSTTWAARVPRNTTSTLGVYWNAEPSPTVASRWDPVSYTAVVQPGGTAGFGFVITTPGADIQPVRSALTRCDIYYP